MKENSMTYEEASELIKSLDPNYTVIYPKYEDENYDFQVFYNGERIAYISIYKEQKIDSTPNLLKFNEGYELWMILAKLAITPLENRGLSPVTLFYLHLFPGDKGYLNYNPCAKTIMLEKKHYFCQFESKFSEDDYNRLQEEYSQYLPKFDEDDPRFEIVN